MVRPARSQNRRYAATLLSPGTVGNRHTDPETRRAPGFRGDVANDQERHGLWPASADVPTGWRMIATGADARRSCIRIEKNWPDIRPKSLRDRQATGRILTSNHSR
ncbi:hypothetical protein MINTMi198_32310 [Mycobacterium intracellulare M.i.198]|uniref:MbtH-like domain-containing protein n=1 Tax=Mycobacterium intracellulare TaxID=1767 RepID=A0A7R7RN48_MYCIT|nr:hypothetical protein MINTM002_31810 [Mycobacterium intracellulare]BCP05759.1 hypothetical protein MINTM019_32150 [Mycobacterium paraintracellulare]BCP37861.1 hypothetical protein MINTMi198_32310 [Mycobacterium intracellulare M.i.198]BCO58053.1 hypothetical protein MINTM005_32970 [Mycobacterium intracellulare]BCO63292.1 hypothetical protein MINTM006_32420 [Mycobacterium intracellulare]